MFKGKLIKGVLRMGSDKPKFDLEIKPIAAEIFAPEKFSFKLQIVRGSQKPDPTEKIDIKQSVKTTDLKKVNFSDPRIIQSEFAVKNGVPEKKTIEFQVLKIEPGTEKETVIASTEVNAAMHFGSSFKQNTISLEPNRNAGGIAFRTFTYQIEIRCANQEDAENFEACIEWRRNQTEGEGVFAANQDR